MYNAICGIKRETIIKGVAIGLAAIALITAVALIVIFATPAIFALLTPAMVVIVASVGGTVSIASFVAAIVLFKKGCHDAYLRAFNNLYSGEAIDEDWIYVAGSSPKQHNSSEVEVPRQKQREPSPKKIEQMLEEL